MIRHRTASGESEEAVRDTARPRTEDLADGVPPRTKTNSENE